MGRILVVDDQSSARSALARVLADEGYEVEVAADAFKALGKYQEFSPEVTITDLRMPGMDGIKLLEKIQRFENPSALVVATAFGGIDSAVDAMRAGAYDFLTKPLNVDELLLVVKRAIETRRLEAEVDDMRERLGDRSVVAGIVGSSPGIAKVCDVIRQVRRSNATVLITGESGTGKELAAQAIHAASPRSKGPFVKLHCAALAESVLESELFGHEHGAFSGASTQRDGRFMLADGGTLFLDEVGEISPAIQIGLLRFLQEREFERVGGNETLQVDVRVIAATNRDLLLDVNAGRFREDLYYRLSVINLEMPALRDRPGDIPALAEHFLHRYAEENDREILGLSDQAIDRLVAHNWPGNVRELENVIERAIVMCSSGYIKPIHLPAVVKAAASDNRAVPSVPGATLADLERYAILTTLEMTNGSTAEAAEILGVSVRKIQYKLRAYKEDQEREEQTTLLN